MFQKIKCIVVLTIIMAAQSVCGMHVDQSTRIYKAAEFENIESYEKYVNELFQENKELLHAAVIVSLRESGELLVYEYDTVENDSIRTMPISPSEAISSIHVAFSYKEGNK
jgi:hypothetical protein